MAFLMLVDVSKNWNFLKYGSIGKHPKQSLYVPCDTGLVSLIFLGWELLCVAYNYSLCTSHLVFVSFLFVPTLLFHFIYSIIYNVIMQSMINTAVTLCSCLVTRVKEY